MPGGRHGLQNRRPDTLCRGVGSIPTLSANLRSRSRAKVVRRSCEAAEADQSPIANRPDSRVTRMKPSRLRAIPSVDKVLQASLKVPSLFRFDVSVAFGAKDYVRLWGSRIANPT